MPSTTSLPLHPLTQAQEVYFTIALTSQVISIYANHGTLGWERLLFSPPELMKQHGDNP